MSCSFFLCYSLIISPFRLFVSWFALSNCVLIPLLNFKGRMRQGAKREWDSRKPKWEGIYINMWIIFNISHIRIMYCLSQAFPFFHKRWMLLVGENSLKWNQCYKFFMLFTVCWFYYLRQKSSNHNFSFILAKL